MNEEREGAGEKEGEMRWRKRCWSSMAGFRSGRRSKSFFNYVGVLVYARFAVKMFLLMTTISYMPVLKRGLIESEQVWQRHSVDGSLRERPLVRLKRDLHQ